MRRWAPILLGLVIALVALSIVPVQAPLVLADASPPAPAPACKGCPKPVPCKGCWEPAADSRWQIQLQGVKDYCKTGGINTAVSAKPYGGDTEVSPIVYAFDPFIDTGTCKGFDPGTLNRPAVEALHGQGVKVIGYVDAGTWEQWRTDQQRFVDFDERCDGCLLGDALSRFQDERWLNINNNEGQRDFLLRRMEARIREVARAGFDGVYFDNQDEFQYATPFHISAKDQIMYLTRLLNLAHSHGLAAGPNNDLLQVELFEPYADYMINEQCFQYTECFHMNPMVAAGKPVFEIEYRPKTIEAVCKKAERRDYNTIRKTNDLFDYPWRPCH